MKIGPERYRMNYSLWQSKPGDDFGAFRMPGPCGSELVVIASPGDANESIPWEHVSVSTRHRTPNWKEMCYVKDLFWEPWETVMQLHPPRAEWINNHPHCLHMWRPLNEKIPLPPPIAVGFKELNPK